MLRRAFCRRRRVRPRAERGFTLMDMLVSLVLVSISMLATVQLTIGVVAANSQSKRTDAAVFLAVEEMETVRNGGYDALTLGTTVTSGIQSLFTRTRTVAAGPRAHTRLVTVRVDWSERRAHSVTLTGLLYDPDFGA